MIVNWFEVSAQPRSKRRGCQMDNESHYKLPVKATLAMIGWLPAYLKQINTHPTLGEDQNGGPDPFPPPRNKREGVRYTRLRGK